MNENIFNSLEEADAYLQDNYNGHGTVIGADTGMRLRTCRCMKSASHPTVYARDEGGYSKTKVKPFDEEVFGKSKVRVLTPKDELKNVRNGVFLAGPAARGTEPIGWREAFINLFTIFNTECTILNPEISGYGEFNAEQYQKQTEWEVDAMHLATRIIFWIPRTDEHPALTTNVEFGEWYAENGVYVGFPIISQHNRYIETKCREVGKDVFHGINEIVSKVLADLNEKPRSFFTSDTHFGSERTLELSKRPFCDVRRMDRKMMSNWNKTVRNCDTVYHLGDFGDWDAFENLNCARLVLVEGNYDRDGGVPKMRRIELHDNPMRVKMNGMVYTLVHEPCGYYGENDFYLYGHVHQTQLVKRNGVNVGVDCNNYKPLSVDDVVFRTKAVKQHYDENVFCEKVGEWK